MNVDNAIKYFQTIYDFTNLPSGVNYKIIKVCRNVLNCLGMLTQHVIQNVPYVCWEQGIQLEIYEEKFIWRVLRLHALQVAYTNWINDDNNRKYNHVIFSYVKNQQKQINIYYNLKSIPLQTLQTIVEKSVIFLDSWELNHNVELLKKCQKLIFSKNIDKIITRYYSEYIPNISPKSLINIEGDIWEKTYIYALLYVYTTWSNIPTLNKPFNLIFDNVVVNDANNTDLYKIYE